MTRVLCIPRPFASSGCDWPRPARLEKRIAGLFTPRIPRDPRHITPFTGHPPLVRIKSEFFGTVIGTDAQAHGSGQHSPLKKKQASRPDNMNRLARARARVGAPARCSPSTPATPPHRVWKPLTRHAPLPRISLATDRSRCERDRDVTEIADAPPAADPALGELSDLDKISTPRQH